MQTVISKDSLIIDDRISQTQHIPEFEILLQTYKDLKPKRILEIGSYMGWSLHHWLKYAEEGATVISIDLPIAEFCGAQDPRCKQQEEAIANEWKSWTKEKNAKLYLIRSASQLQKTVDAVKELLNGDELDFVFIDGDHRYEAVRADFELYFPMVRGAGVVALHDIGYAEEGGVHRLWDNIKDDRNRFLGSTLRLHPKQEKGIGIAVKVPIVRS